MKLDGGAQFAKVLESLPFSAQRGVLNAILKKAGVPVKARMEELAPKGDPHPVNISDSIVVRSVSKIDDGSELEARSLDDSEAAVAIGPTKDAFYAHFQEFGTAPHGNHPGNPPQPFARPAFDQTQDAVLRSIQDDIWARLRDAAGGRSTTGRNL